MVVHQIILKDNHDVTLKSAITPVATINPRCLASIDPILRTLGVEERGDASASAARTTGEGNRTKVACRDMFVTAAPWPGFRASTN